MYSFFPGGYGEEARAAAQKAMEAQTKAEDAERRVQNIVDKLPEDQRKVRQIPIDIEMANQNIKEAQGQVGVATSSRGKILTAMSSIGYSYLLVVYHKLSESHNSRTI